MTGYENRSSSKSVMRPVYEGFIDFIEASVVFTVCTLQFHSGKSILKTKCRTVHFLELVVALSSSALEVFESL